MGTVQAVGTGVKNVAAGDRVVACFDIACGRCLQCKQARPSLVLREGAHRAIPHSGLALVWLWALLPEQAGGSHEPAAGPCKPLRGDLGHLTCM